ncbi:SpaA isopeptide-forming pilin-related protein, partial [Streptococcus sp.]|uniref:SpaA isopeptide-forming pilin-related protein n=1 Tax=Streptococcus sp. TaxID=1306 RepID=UPI00182CD705
DLTKTFVSEEDTDESDVKVLKWKTKITMPASGVIEKGTNFRDFLTDPYNQNSEVHWYTKAQLQDLYKKLVKFFGDSKFTLKACQKPWDGYTNYEDLDNNTKYTEFQIILTDDFKSSKNIVLQYQSTAKLNGNANLDFWNTISSADHSSQAKYHHTDNSNVIKMDGDENHATTKKTSTDGVVTWKVKVNLSDDATSMTVTDTLPEGVSLTGLTYGQHWGQISAVISGTSITSGENGWGTYNINLTGSISDDNVVTLNFSTTDGKTLKNNIGGNNDFWLTFTTTYNNLPEEGTLVTDTLTNTVSVIVDGDQDYGSDSQTQIITFGKDKQVVKPITKTGSWDNNNRALHYSLSINPSAEDLVDGTDELTLTDVLTFYGEDISVALNQSSVKLYYADSGEEVPTSEWSWKVSLTDNGYGTYTSTLTVTLKDATAYTLSYDYLVSKENPDTSKTYWPKNTATLSGVSNGSAKKEVTVAWSKIGTDAGIDTEKSYTINKVDADNYGLGLANAVFTVYKYDGDDNDSNDKAIATYTTDANGHITITKSNLPSTFTEGKFYYFKETKAPSGYELPDSPRKYYFYYNTENTITPTGVLSGAVNLAKVSDSAYVENEKIKTIDLTINKKWFTADGDETSRSDGSITYDVIQVATAEDRTSTESTYLSGETLSHDDDWTKTYTELPVSGTDSSGNAVTYTYYVKENAVSGYDTSYTNSNNDVPTEEAADMAIASDSATITIRNTAQKQYDLPETGGNGTQWHYIAGAVLSLLAIGLLIFKVYKRYQIGGRL